MRTSFPLPRKYTQLLSPFEVLDNVFAGTIKKRRPMSNAAVESVANPWYLRGEEYFAVNVAAVGK